MEALPIENHFKGDSGKNIIIYGRESKSKKNNGGVFNSMNFNPGNFLNFKFLNSSSYIDANVSQNENQNVTEDEEINSAIIYQMRHMQKFFETLKINNQNYKPNIVMVESDVGSGWSKKSVKQLSGLNRIKERLERYKNNAIVLVTSVSRISRNYEEISSEFLKECKKNGIKVYALRDNLIYDSKNKSNLSADFIKGCIDAQKQSTDLSMKMREYHSQQKELGNITGQVEYGYKRKKEDGVWQKVENVEEKNVIIHICITWNNLFTLFKNIYGIDKRVNNSKFDWTIMNNMYNEMTKLLLDSLNNNNIMRRGKDWTMAGIKNLIIRNMGEMYFHVPTEKKYLERFTEDEIKDFDNLMKNLSISLEQNHTNKKQKLTN